MSTAWVMWSAAAGASSYSVQAVTDSGAPVTCGSSNSSCHLNGLQCSRMYNVTVTAHNQACSSLPSETTHLLTGLSPHQEEICSHKPLLMLTCVFPSHVEPCQPTNIQASLDCENLSATVSWQQSPLSVGYVAYADNKNGHRTSCFSSNATSCSLSGLVCGNVYSVWVKALGQQYYSSDSSVVSLTSGKNTQKYFQQLIILRKYKEKKIIKTRKLKKQSQVVMHTLSSVLSKFYISVKILPSTFLSSGPNESLSGSRGWLLLSKARKQPEDAGSQTHMHT